MNKKFSTLMAGLLLAGGVFSVANASNWTKDTRYVQNSGKYFLIQQTGRYTGDATTNSGSWQPITSTKYYLKWNETEKKVYYVNNVNLGDKDAYWTVKICVNSGQTEYQLVNANGKIFQHTYTNASGKDVKVQWFLSAYDGPERVPSSINVDVNTLYFYDDQSKAQYIYPEQDVNGDWYVAAQELNSLSSIADGFNNIEIEEDAISADDMNKMLKGGFSLAFGYTNDDEYEAYSDLQGNVFTGEIEAKTAKTSGTYYFYRKADKKYLLLADGDMKDIVWSENTANLDGKESSAYRGYKFTALSEHDFAQLSDAKKKARAEFQVFKSYDFNNTDSLIVTLPNAKVGEMPKPWGNTTDKGVRLFVSTVAGKNYLTVIEYDKANDRLADVNNNGYTNTEVGALAPYIKFGGTNILDIPREFAGKIWNITTGSDENEMSLSPVQAADVDSYEQLFAPIKQVDLTNPEGQWLLYADEDGDYYFVNRESGAKFNITTAADAVKGQWVIRKINGKFEICKNAYTTDAWKVVNITEAKDAELGHSGKGYVEFDMDEEQVNGKYMSFETALGETYYIGKDKDDNVKLTKNESEAIEFRVKQMEHNFSDHSGYAAPDTLHHYTSYLKYNEKDELVSAVDTLEFFQYALYENFSEKYLKYDVVNKKFVLSEDWAPLNEHENFDLYGADYAFVVKEKADGSYILVRDYAIDYDYCNKEAGHEVWFSWNRDKKGNKVKYTFDDIFEVNLGDNAYDMDGDFTNGVDPRNDKSDPDATKADNLYSKASHKVYFAAQPGTITDVEGIYNYNDNDRVTIEPTNKVEYMTITGSQDTVKISAKDFTNFFLYEQGQNGTNFLGMNHVADVKDMKAAILADTAYVRNNTHRPQYLLAVDTDIKPEIPCDIPGHPTLHPDTVYGRFLINAVDSANAYGINKKSNPYIWDRNDYFRLIFVDGYHTGDALTLHTDKADTKIALNNNDDKVCTFAFRYVDEERKGVKIETTYDHNKRGWLKYQNHFAVVTSDYDDADVFYVDNTTTDAPTANEEISAGNVVVAGVNGAVVVKGAEGKNVIVSTILGKVVANEVVSSDNATIAAPAGIVVVSVDGESFKVVVK